MLHLISLAGSLFSEITLSRLRVKWKSRDIHKSSNRHMKNGRHIYGLVRSSCILNAVKQNIIHCRVTHMVTEWRSDLPLMIEWRSVCLTHWLCELLNYWANEQPLFIKLWRLQDASKWESYRTCKTILYLLHTIFNENDFHLWMCFSNSLWKGILRFVPYTSHFRES